MAEEKRSKPTGLEIRTFEEGVIVAPVIEEDGTRTVQEVPGRGFTLTVPCCSRYVPSGLRSGGYELTRFKGNLEGARRALEEHKVWKTPEGKYALKGLEFMGELLSSEGGVYLLLTEMHPLQRGFFYACALRSSPECRERLNQPFSLAGLIGSPDN
ncbi:MAG: hypothetical protein V2A62_02140 [Candidatus Woesearchaeota archaeon]